jgi:hypothetical protein
MAFKMKYTNGKTADVTAFPFKGGVAAGSSPAKGWFSDIGKKVVSKAKDVTKDVDWGSVGKGAAQGAAAGSVAGPWGAIIGGLGGAVMGGMSGKEGKEGDEELAEKLHQERIAERDEANTQALPNEELNQQVKRSVTSQPQTPDEKMNQNQLT